MRQKVRQNRFFRMQKLATCKNKFGEKNKKQKTPKPYPAAHRRSAGSAAPPPAIVAGVRSAAPTSSSRRCPRIDCPHHRIDCPHRPQLSLVVARVRTAARSCRRGRIRLPRSSPAPDRPPSLSGGAASIGPAACGLSLAPDQPPLPPAVVAGAASATPSVLRRHRRRIRTREGPQRLIHAGWHRPRRPSRQLDPAR